MSPHRHREARTRSYTRPGARSCATAAAAMVLTALTACSAVGGSDPLTELRDRPSHEQALAGYTTMQREIQDAVTTAVPTVIWQLGRASESSAGCADPFDNLGGTTKGLDLYYAEGGIPDDTWPRAVSAAVAVAQRYGLTEITTTVDRPADHQVRLTNPTDGAHTDLGTGANAIIRTVTGCNLPADALSTTPPATR